MQGPSPRPEAGDAAPLGCPPVQPRHGFSGNHQENEFASAQQLDASRDPHTPSLKPKSGPQRRWGQLAGHAAAGLHDSSQQLRLGGCGELGSGGGPQS